MQFNAAAIWLLLWLWVYINGMMIRRAHHHRSRSRWWQTMVGGLLIQIKDRGRWSALGGGSLEPGWCIHGLAHNSMRRYSGTEGETATEILRQRELARDRERNADARNGWESGPYFVWECENEQWTETMGISVWWCDVRIEQESYRTLLSVAAAAVVAVAALHVMPWHVTSCLHIMPW